MQPELRYFKCPSHPKYVLEMVCKSVECQSEAKLLCTKCQPEHPSCESSIIPLEDFLEKLDDLKFQQSIDIEIKNYVAQVELLRVGAK